MFDKVKNIMDLAKSIDFGKLEEISKKSGPRCCHGRGLKNG